MTLKLNSGVIQKAVEALEETAYEKNKKIIKKLFELPTSKCPVLLRLRVVDSFYSTNFRMRQFGFEELASAIDNLGNDNNIRKRLKQIIDRSDLSIDEDISELFARDDWGAVRKNGRKPGHAKALISKYFYFLSGFNFPIYDSFVKEGLLELKGSYPEKFSDLLQELSKLRIKYETRYEYLDNFFWLWRKIESKSYSLLVDNKDVYERIEGKKKFQVIRILEKDKKYSKLCKFIRTLLKNR